MRIPFFAAVALLVAAPASADWQRATSPHFIIYADESPIKLKTFAEKLTAAAVERTPLPPTRQIKK